MATVLLPPPEPVEAEAEGVTEEIPARERLLRLAQHEGDLSFALDETGLTELGEKVVEDYDHDRKDRKEWEDAVKEALKSAGQEHKGEPKKYPWNEASDVRYPLITVGALQFGARALPAIIKGDEVVSVRTVGQDQGQPVMGPDGQPAVQQGPDGQPQPVWKVPPGAKASRAQRVRDYMNSVIFYRMDDWESDTDHLLHQLPIVGCAFRKLWWDGGPKAALVPALRLVAPMGAKSCKTAPRLTEEIPDVYPVTILERMRSDHYRSVDLGVDKDKLDHKPRLLLEQHRLEDLDEDGFPEPYIVTVDHETREVLRIEANFSPESITWNGEKVARIDKGYFYVKYDFFPHPEGKFYGIGLGHLLKHIGSVVDTAINQMIDAGTAQVAGGGFVGSGVRLTGSRRTGNLRFAPGEYKTVDAPGDQLRNAIVERTFPGPSNIMFQILEMMLGAATDISSVKDIITGEASNNGQVGTTLALIEQGLAQFTAIYKRIYRSLKEEYQLLYDNLAKYGAELAQDYQTVLDDPRADFAADFDTADMDIRPVSDPSSVTKMQKMARAQFLMQFVGAPGVNPQAIYMRAWEAADVEDAEELLLPPPAPPEPDPKDVADAEAKQAGAMKDLADMDKKKAETEAIQLENLAKAFGAGQMMGLA